MREEEAVCRGSVVELDVEYWPVLHFAGFPTDFSPPALDEGRPHVLRVVMLTLHEILSVEKDVTALIFERA